MEKTRSDRAPEPNTEQQVAHPSALRKGRTMSKSSRRTFLIMSGAGVAAAGVAAAMPAGAATPKPLTTPDDAAPLVAHISDPGSGDVTLMVDDREVVVHDHDLVARLTRAAKSGD
jgi:hypothetical protein